MARKKRRYCGNCFWYDAIGNICRNEEKTHDFDDVDTKNNCKKLKDDKLNELR